MPPFLPAPRRVLFLLTDLAFGGVERVCLNLLRHLPVAPFSCDVFTCGNSTAMQAELPAYVRRLAGAETGLRMRQALPTLLTQLRTHMRDYDVIVATSPHTTLLMHLACLGRPIRKLTWVHFNAEGFMPKTSALIRHTARAAYAGTQERIFVSEGVRASFARYFGGKQTDRVIHNIFDPSAYAASSGLAATVAHLKSTGKPVLGVVSRLVKEKGLPELVAIHQELLSRGFEHNLAIIGDGPLMPELRAIVAHQGLEATFHLLGADASPLAAMRLCDLMLLASEHEAWPTVVLEAFAAQTPIISFACPSGPAEMLTGDLAPCLVQSRTPQAFANSVLAALPRRAELVRAGVGRLADFSTQQLIPQWVRLLDA